VTLAQRGDVETSKELNALREFVYLDQVSLTSLWASRYGESIEQLTDTHESSRESEMEAGIEARSPLLRARLRSTLRGRETSTAQVQRRANAQATFKRFYERERDRLKLSPRSLEASGRLLVKQGPPTADSKVNHVLQRGDLVEVEGALLADKIHRVSSMVSVMTEMAEAHPSLFGGSIGVFDEVAPVNALVATLLAGLIPLRCSATGIVAVPLGGRHVLTSENVDTSAYSGVRPVELVGVTVENLYWKDIRRVLFQGDRYKLLCRLTVDGLSEDWAPVVLSNVLRELNPELADLMNSLGSSALDAMTKSTPAPMSRVENGDQVRKALAIFEALAAGELGISLDDVPHDAQREAIFGAAVGHVSVEQQSTLFARLLERVELVTTGLSIASDRAHELRRDARDQAGLNAIQQSASGSSTSANPLLLQAEIVAIYW
jgi:hypothetical protein